MHCYYNRFIVLLILLHGMLDAHIKYDINNKFGHDVLLIINYNHPWYDTIPFLQKIYGDFFPHIVFYGPKKDPRVELCEHNTGRLSYTAISDAMEKNPGYKGYLFLHDDCFLNFWNITRFSKEKIWICGGEIGVVDKDNPKTGTFWWPQPCGMEAFIKVHRDLPKKYRNMFEKNYGDKAIMGFSDIVYIPNKYKNEFKALCGLCAQHSLYLDIAVTTMCACLENKENWELIKGKPLWNNHRDNPSAFYNKSLDYVHPLKFGSFPELKDFVMQQIREAIK
jgi:hypothetical protein